MGAVQARMETVLQRLLPRPEIVPERLHRAMHYAVLGGGKRVRPLLAFAAGELADADPARVEIVAADVEMIHAYSLVHDDMPCMDNDVLRRGRPTCHVEFDQATALLVGDALQPLAFQILTEHVVADDPGAQLEMLGILAVASGSRGMAGGQAIDLASVGKTLTLPELELMHIHKTGALIRAAAVLGARCGRGLDARQFGRLEHYGLLVGNLTRLLHQHGLGQTLAYLKARAGGRPEGLYQTRYDHLSAWLTQALPLSDADALVGLTRGDSQLYLRAGDAARHLVLALRRAVAAASETPSGTQGGA